MTPAFANRFHIDFFGPFAAVRFGMVNHHGPVLTPDETHSFVVMETENMLELARLILQLAAPKETQGG